MRLGLLSVLLLLSSACGPAVLGTWRLSGNAQTGAGTQQFAYDFLLIQAGWDLGGGCVAPLNYNGQRAILSTPNWACALSSAAPVPMASITGYTWKSGDVLVIVDAQFELLPSVDKLHIDMSSQVRTDPNDPTVGPQTIFRSNAGDGATRVK